jgi:hypothetical protein
MKADIDDLQDTPPPARKRGREESFNKNSDSVDNSQNRSIQSGRLIKGNGTESSGSRDRDQALNDGV